MGWLDLVLKMTIGLQSSWSITDEQRLNCTNLHNGAGYPEEEQWTITSHIVYHSAVEKVAVLHKDKDPANGVTQAYIKINVDLY